MRGLQKLSSALGCLLLMFRCEQQVMIEVAKLQLFSAEKDTTHRASHLRLRPWQVLGMDACSCSAS